MEFDDPALGFYAFKTMALIILLQEVRGIQLVLRLPGVVCLRVSFPFKEILKSFVLSEIVMTSDGLHLVLHFSVDQVRGRSREVGAVCRCLNKRG
jgi:hypothetical protein